MCCSISRDGVTTGQPCVSFLVHTDDRLKIKNILVAGVKQKGTKLDFTKQAVMALG